MTDKIILPMRAAYMLEYVPKGARKPRCEMVSEIVPVEVKVDPDLQPAIVSEGSDYYKEAVSGDRVYNWMSMEEPTTAGWLALVNGQAQHDTRARRSTLFRRNDLLRQGAKDTSVLDAPLRDTLEIREMLSDGRVEGVAHAQRMADELVIRDDVIYRLSTAVPSIEVIVKGRGIEATRSTFDIRPTGTWRNFRIDDVEGAKDFVRRHAEAIGKEVRLDTQGLERPAILKWSEAGLAAEATDAWWVIRAGDALARNPLAVATHEPMDLDTGLLLELMAIRGLVDPYRRADPRFLKDPYDTTLQSPSDARRIAGDVIERLGRIRDMLGDDLRDQPRAMARTVNFILTEAQEYAPGLAADSDDLDAISAFIP